MPAPGDQYRDTRASVNPFEEQKAHVNEYTAQEIATLQSRLEKQLGPEYISTRPGAGGGKVHYLAAEKVINLANEVFGFNGWSSSIQNVQVDFVDESAGSGKISLGLSTIIRVTLKDGTYHEDIGYGHIENCKGKAAAFEKAKKEAATDALKRALRNFGNVLGNCLYDKDYLQRITKVKVAPSKWDADNLHRHPDYAPVKKESIADIEEAKQNRPMRLPSGHSVVSNGTEYGEDEFGGNLFDEVDFSHPDEVQPDASVTETHLQTPHGQKMQAGRVQVARVKSMPAMNIPNNTRPPNQAQHAQQPHRPMGHQQVGHNGPQRPDQGGMLPPPIGMQTAQGSSALPADSSNRANHTSTARTSIVNTAGSNGAQQRPAAQVNKTLTPPEVEGGPALQQNGPDAPEGPIGFVTGRAAGTGTVQPFNPHAESPSIPRTRGVNHAKSEPIVRSAVGAAVTPAPTGPINSISSGAAQQRPNFVNPAADMNRRIGMPGTGMQSPMGNRGAYKPPTAIKRPAPIETPSRPPLTDMSNMQQLDGSADAKKAKLEPTPPDEVLVPQ